MRKTEVLQPEIKNSLVCFERFLKTVGFKRIEGSVYGFLILTEEPVTLAEIHERLNISQGAASQAIKSLTQWGAVESKWEPEKRAQVHLASEDSLKIVTTIFKKREQMAIEEFKQNAQSAIESFVSKGEALQSPRIRRLNSIVLTCEAAEAVISFVDSLSQIGNIKKYQIIVRNLPKAFNAVIAGTEGTKIVATKIKEKIRSVKNQTLRSHEATGI